MLVLRRKVGDAVILDGGIEVQVLEITGNRVKLGFIAPPEVLVARKELYLTQEANRRAAERLPADGLSSLAAALRSKIPHANLGPTGTPE